MPTNRAKVPPSPKVAERLALLIRYHGIKKAELARGVGVTPAAVTQWTKGETAISPEKGLAIAEFLDEDYDFVMGLSDKGSKGMGKALDRLGAERLRKISELPRKQFDEMLALIDGFFKPESDADSDD